MSLTSYRAAPSRVIASAEPGSDGKAVLMRVGAHAVNPRSRVIWPTKTPAPKDRR